MKEKISITLDEEIIRDVDRLVDGSKVKNRSHAIELLISKSLAVKGLKTAIFLLGGKSSKIVVNKSLLLFNGKTVLEHLIEMFKKFGVTNFIFSISSTADKIKQQFGDGSKFGVSIIFVEEKEPLGSAGAIKFASAQIEDGPFIVTNGDELKEIDIKDMFNFHKSVSAKITVALTTVKDTSAYGVAAMKGNKILHFVEKPKTEDAPSNLINSGLSIWEKNAIEQIPEGFSTYEKDVFPKLAGKGELYGYVFEGQWFDTNDKKKLKNAIKQWRGIKNE